MKGFLVAEDAAVDCPRKGCKAPAGTPCTPIGTEKPTWKPGWVHFGRRVRRLLAERRAPQN